VKLYVAFGVFAKSTSCLSALATSCSMATSKYLSSSSVRGSPNCWKKGLKSHDPVK
jgi:hypothetical protein